MHIRCVFKNKEKAPLSSVCVPDGISQRTYGHGRIYFQRRLRIGVAGGAGARAGAGVR